jgi:hypothetical protein
MLFQVVTAKVLYACYLKDGVKNYQQGVVKMLIISIVIFSETVADSLILLRI